MKRHPRIIQSSILDISCCAIGAGNSGSARSRTTSCSPACAVNDRVPDSCFRGISQDVISMNKTNQFQDRDHEDHEKDDHEHELDRRLTRAGIFSLHVSSFRALPRPGGKCMLYLHLLKLNKDLKV